MDTINGVLYFNVSGEILMYVKQENKTLIVKGESINTGVDYHKFFFLNKPLYSIKGLSYYGKELLVDGFFLGSSVDYNQFTFVLMTESELDSNDNYAVISNYSLFNIKSKEKIYLDRLRNIVHCINQNNFVVLSSESQIHAYTLPTAQPLWQFSLEGLGTYFETFHKEEKPYEVSKFLGVWQDQLLVACSNGLILCLNMETGKEVRRFHQCPAYQLGSHINTHFDSSDVFQLNEACGKLIALYAYFYMEIDLLTNEISIYPLEDDMNKNGLSFFRRSFGYAIDGDLIYTIAEVANHNSPISKGDRCILAFNKKTKKVVWQYLFEDDSVNTDIPQYANNKLYQLTSSKTLHIFQKENT